MSIPEGGPAVSRNFLARHWRGGFSLPVAYWVIGILTNLALTLYSLFVSHLFLDTPYNPLLLWLLASASWLGASAAVTWQFVGTWRSAGHQIADPAKRSAWGYLARGMVLLAGINAVSVLANTAAPQIAELTDMAFRGDTLSPDYRLAVSDDGTELLVEGGFKYGLTMAVEQALAAAPGVKVINLNSPGGRVGEARELFRLIDTLRLKTLTNATCASACTIAFAAGTERWMGPAAKLGFHAAMFPGLTEGQVKTAQQGILNEIMRRNGTPPGFFARAENTPSQEMWYPTRQELLANRYLTAALSPAASTQRVYDQVLAHMHQSLRGQLPLRVDTMTMLVKTESHGRVFVFVYEVSGIGAGMMLDADTQAGMQRTASRTICENSRMRHDLEEGIVYGYRYLRESGRGEVLYFEVSGC